MTVFYGLGNNETKYLRTKHNIGRVIIEQLAIMQNLEFSSMEGCKYAKSGENWLAYSEGYMNVSGLPLSKLLRYYKVDVQAVGFRLVIIQDDSDQLIGNCKLVAGGGSAGHNGIISCYSHLAPMGLTQDKIWRLKIGIRPVDNKSKSEIFVLSSLSPIEIEFAKILLDLILKTKVLWEAQNFPRLQNFFCIKNQDQKNNP